ncbi:hypothetical protein L3X38_000035 [Prunus dulcis]|uniref:Uncharacterized protein n=1 Tax=Prunus dulcis TaxID=3755 RepID=A0AAD4USX4_PRUDU|nr:hypothetical protein L3X38_000035 [Prunus dulcis]
MENSELPKDIKNLIRTMEGSDGGFVDRLSLTSDRRIQIPGEEIEENQWGGVLVELDVISRDQLRRSTILSALGPPLCPHDFVSGNSRATSQWVTHPGIALAPNLLNFGVPTTPKPVSSQKELMLDGCGCAHIRHITPSPLVDVGSYNPPPSRARRPRRHTRATRQSGSEPNCHIPGKV